MARRSGRKTLKNNDEIKAYRSEVLKNSLHFNLEKYEYSDAFVKARNVHEAHTVSELYEFAKKGLAEVDCKALFFKEKKYGYKKLDTKKFIEAFENKNNFKKFKESSYLFDYDDYNFTSRVGDDFIPLLGGAFNKQLYYADYLRMHALCFHAWNHDPVAKRIVNTIKNFSLGKGFRIDTEKKESLAILRAFEKAMDLQEFAKYICIESIIYGEVFVWKLPQNNLYFSYENFETIPKSIIPRFRLIDPSVIWEIVTYPEDIERVLGYWWVAPTQYQIKSNILDKSVPTAKFIMQELPANQVRHYKRNCVSNEKRGRSELFSVLGYMKRLRDSVNYQIIADQKNSAWAIDTSIEGSQSDIDRYIQSMKAIGDIPPAGSEFVHSSKVKREYLSNVGSKPGASNSFEWALSMISIGTGVPISYLGSHLSGAQTRASAIVSTEPVVKIFEEVQQFVSKVITNMCKDVLSHFGITDEVEVTFPEIISQDRSSKLRDISVAEINGWISKKRAAQMAAEELAIDNYDYDKELDEIKKYNTNEYSNDLNFLTSPPKIEKEELDNSKLSSDEKRGIKNEYV